MRRFALLLGVALSLLATSAVAQSCDGFTDVLASSPFCPDVTFITAHGITKGCAPSQFCPDDSVTRLQMAAFLHRLGQEDPSNTLGDHTTTIGGGTSNTSTGNWSTVGGGVGNQATGPYSTIGGGFTSLASGDTSTVAGGQDNIASGNESTVAGGQSNTASGVVSTVAGGYANAASGEGSFAAGEYANAANDGCFVFSDTSSSTTTDCDGTNAFVARAEGGFFLITSGVNGTYAGAVLSTGSGSWTTFSDRAAKAHVQPVDPQEVLARVSAMPLSTWNYNAQEPSIRHMGPMAQDFYSAFALGETDKGISVVDAQGVAFAAIQGLNAKVDEQVTRLDSAVQEKSHQLEEQAATIREQQREIAELKEQVQYTNSLAADLVALQAALAELQHGRETVAVR